MDLFDYIQKRINSSESRRFKMKTFFNYHLSLYQDINQVNFQFSISHSSDDEHNWVICLFLLFWGIEYSWNSRKEEKEEVEIGYGGLGFGEYCPDCGGLCGNDKHTRRW